jgi:hypothetical protein
MQSTETKGVEEKLDDETSGSAGFSGIKKKDLLLLRDKPVFLDPQLLDFSVQRRAGNSEFRCRTFVGHAKRAQAYEPTFHVVRDHKVS